MAKAKKITNSILSLFGGNKEALEQELISYGFKKGANPLNTILRRAETATTFEEAVKGLNVKEGSNTNYGKFKAALESKTTSVFGEQTASSQDLKNTISRVRKSNNYSTPNLIGQAKNAPKNPSDKISSARKRKQTSIDDASSYDVEASLNGGEHPDVEAKRILNERKQNFNDALAEEHAELNGEKELPKPKGKIYDGGITNSNWVDSEAESYANSMNFPKTKPSTSTPNADRAKPSQKSGGNSNVGKQSGGDFLGLERGADRHRAADWAKEKKAIGKLAKEGSLEDINKFLGEKNKITEADLGDRESLEKIMLKHGKGNFRKSPDMMDYIAGNPKAMTTGAGIAVGFGAIATVNSNGGRRSNSSLYGSPF